MSLKIAVPNKGALSEGATALLKEAGYRCTRSGRELVVLDAENDVEFFFLRPRDVAIYVGRGIIDLGITGRDLAADSGADVTELMPLEFGRSRFCFAAPRNTVKDPHELQGKRIATSYPELLRQQLQKLGITASTVRLDGAVEISIRLGVADAIADVVESGATLKEAGLEIIGDPMLHSEAIVIGRSQEIAEKAEVRRLIARFHGVIVAQNFEIVEYDIPRTALEAACKLTPGVESPTVSPLTNPDWVAVKAMIRKKEGNRIMDELYAIGARGILVTDIRACRL